MFINYHEKNACNPISSKYLHTCSLPNSSFSLPKRKIIKGMKTSHQNQALPKAQHSTAEGGSMHAQPHYLWLKLQPWFSWTENSCSQTRGGGQRRFGLQPGVSIHPANTCPYPWPCHKNALVTSTCGLATACHCWHLEAPGVEVGLDGGEGWCQAWHWQWRATQHQPAGMEPEVGRAWHLPPCNTQHSTWSAAAIKSYI